MGKILLIGEAHNKSLMKKKINLLRKKGIKHLFLEGYPANRNSAIYLHDYLFKGLPLKRLIERDNLIFNHAKDLFGVKNIYGLEPTSFIVSYPSHNLFFLLYSLLDPSTKEYMWFSLYSSLKLFSSFNYNQLLFTKKVLSFINDYKRFVTISSFKKYWNIVGGFKFIFDNIEIKDTQSYLNFNLIKEHFFLISLFEEINKYYKDIENRRELNPNEEKIKFLAIRLAIKASKLIVEYRSIFFAQEVLFKLKDNKLDNVAIIMGSKHVPLVSQIFRDNNLEVEPIYLYTKDCFEPIALPKYL